jgi:signal transduction histidine kinase/ActR/RegA family two-component response regulator
MLHPLWGGPVRVTAWWQRVPLRLATVGVLVLLVSASVGSWAAARAVSSSQEERLLKARVGEVVLVLQSALTGIGSSLQVLGTVATVEGSGEDFPRSARPLMRDGVTTVGVAEERSSGLVAVGSIGQGVASGQPLGRTRSDVAARALDSGALAAGLVAGSAGQRLMVAVPIAGPGRVVAYQESAVDPSRPTPAEPDSPYSELDIALYAGPQVSPDLLVLTTAQDLPLTGSVDHRTFRVGADRWTLVTQTREPLTGSLARVVPWAILGTGLLVAMIIAALVETISRRRSYASTMVERRTAELQQAVKAQQEAQQVAESANTAKSEFLSRMSHELRTPLNAVLGFAQLLEFTDLDDDQREQVGHIGKAGQHLLTLIDEVLDISRIESGSLALSPEALLVGDLVSESIDLVRPMVADAGLQIAGGRAAACQTYIFADRQRLKQVLLNLLSNAVKYNRRGGVVAVDCEQPVAGRLRITVADTGPGIRPEDQARLFVPFERLGADQSDVEGTGIGLALSRRLTTAMGGVLDLSTKLSRGSTFWVEFPVVEEPANRHLRLTGETLTDPDEASVRTLRHTILYIEDNLANLRLVETIVGRRGDVDIIPAMQGGLGLELAREHRPALILLDLHLPDMHGEEVLHRLRDDPDTAATPVVILTADATPRQAQRLLAAGAIDYLTKPVNVHELLRTLDEVLAPV